MKIAGIIRRIDNLGRVVIPKEIRQNLRIKNGENLEIFLDEYENIVLKKYSQIDKLKDIAEELSKAITNIVKKNIIITNTKDIVYAKKIYQTKELSKEIIKLIEQRQDIYQKQISNIKITNIEENKSYIICPIITNGDLVGSVIIIDDELTDIDFKIAKIASSFLANYIEG